jgi:hypothetical protein
MSNSDSLNLRFFTDYLEHYNNKWTIKSH